MSAIVSSPSLSQAFFISEAIKNITEIRESLDQEERDILSFVSNPDE